MRLRDDDHSSSRGPCLTDRRGPRPSARGLACVCPAEDPSRPRRGPRSPLPSAFIVGMPNIALSSAPSAFTIASGLSSLPHLLIMASRVTSPFVERAKIRACPRLRNTRSRGPSMLPSIHRAPRGRSRKTRSRTSTDGGNHHVRSWPIDGASPAPGAIASFRAARGACMHDTLIAVAFFGCLRGVPILLNTLLTADTTDLPGDPDLATAEREAVRQRRFRFSRRARGSSSRRRWPIPRRRAADGASLLTTSDDVAFLVLPSGSTGRPERRHPSASHLLHTAAALWRERPRDARRRHRILRRQALLRLWPR